MIEQYICPNGVRIVHEKMPYVRSVALGIWVGAGSGDEQESEAGIAHFIEHMLFKGTATRSARTIAEEFDRIGGDVNAFTSKEMTCYYTTVLGHHAPRALTILADMFFNSAFDEAEIAKEKSIVLDEIAAVEDTPDDDVDERLWGVMYPDQAIGKPVLGNEQTINTFNKQMIEQFMERMYRPEQIVISIAGNYDDRLIQLIKVQFGSFKRQAKVEQPIAVQAPEFHAGMTVKAKDIEQAHICIGYPGLTVKDERIHDLIILDSILGGTMSSRLFQEVREERGLAYSICSYYSAYNTTGVFAIYGGTAPENLGELSDTIDEVIQSILREGITENELHNAKEQLKGGFLLGLESSESRMHRNGKNELILQEHKTIDEVVALIDNVQVANVYRMANDIFTQQRATSIIAPENTVNTIEI
ncbi:pitrilysin family protein [Sporosarcina sp. YIM B06819]|uniref:M16 family metallopeptidase n=1 Tax=Sporosarcina sp. YIM B06819 TaxID=3081769 RepID=UPI00298CB4B5|nr:pitrilysin family protein [Sporosarcina sp. YIM B06819]